MILGNGVPMCPYCGKPILLGYPHEACVTEYSRFMEEASNAWQRDIPQDLDAGQIKNDLDFRNQSELMEYLETIMAENCGSLVLNPGASKKLVMWIRSLIVLTKDQGEFIRFLKEKRFEVLTKGARNELE